VEWCFHDEWLVAERMAGDGIDLGKWNCRSLGFPGFPVDLVGVDGLHAVFSYRKPQTRLCPVQRGRKFGFARDDKGWGCASMIN
jgi:hypothetical protein